jgi:hypothetical protein
MRYADVEALATDEFSNRLKYNPMPAFSPGPATDALIQKLGPGRLIFLTVGGGSSQTTEGLFDQPFITARVIGKQFDYEDAETMAWDLDGIFMRIGGNRMVGAAFTLRIARSGGVPQLLECDTANRYHFTCSYITETQAEGVAS